MSRSDTHQKLASDRSGLPGKGVTMSMIVPVLEEPEIEVIRIRIPSPLNSRNGKCSWHTVGKMKKKVKKQYNKYYFF